MAKKRMQLKLKQKMKDRLMAQQVTEDEEPGTWKKKLKINEVLKQRVQELIEHPIQQENLQDEI